jgi:hypothetical protein
MHCRYLILIAVLVSLLPAPCRAFTGAELIDGFDRTVFGSEYTTFGWQSHLVKKFAGPVLLHVDDRSAAKRGGEVAAFARTLSGLIRGLELHVVADAQDANYRVFVVDRTAYRETVAREVYRRADSTYAPGRCLVRIVSTSSGITRSDAVIVADEGEFLFRRCMVEEVLQGLGPVNDDSTLDESVFNDTSRHASFTDFDRHILNMLYHPLVEPGMTRAEVDRILPKVASEVRFRLR